MSAILKNMFINFAKSGYACVMTQKIKKRLFEHKDKSVLERNLSWCKEVYQEFDLLANKLNSSLWQESKDFEKILNLRAKAMLEKINVDLGGGGYYPLLYFITRFFKPEIVVETGVAAGYSSQSFLKAMDVNNKGRLYSSDFPYFRLENPEKYIGILVEENLKKRWKLFIKGDKYNLPRIVNKINKVDIFHYDSDKTYSGRLFAMRIVEKFLHKDSIIIMDDIQDNSFFCDYVKNLDRSWKVFHFAGKFIGCIGI